MTDSNHLNVMVREAKYVYETSEYRIWWRDNRCTSTIFVFDITHQYWMLIDILEVNLKWKYSMYAIKTAYTHK